MDFLSSLAKGESKPDNSDQKTSNSDLFASAKLVADAAQSQFRNEPDKYDKAKVAGATADLLDAASQYGKLDETKGVGKYVDQAEDYLRQYSTSTTAPVPVAADSSDNKTTAADAPVPDSGEQKPITTDAPAQTAANTTTTTTTETTEKPSGGGAGDYIKLAEGFLNKASDEKTEGSSQSEGGYGDLMKMAGGFLKK